MHPKVLKEKIMEMKEEKNAVILAHNYQIEEVQDIADYIGDSLGLSQKAVDLDAEIIVFCGVDFMAESAAILSPAKTVLLPEVNADCPMASMVTAEELQQEKDKYPKSTVICYVNSSAEVKAKSDFCCTSSNAVDIVQAVNSSKILFVPDKNLGQYVAEQTAKEIRLWDGYCITHHRVQAEDVRKVRSVYPHAPVIVHPECRPEVVALADYVGSTSQILDYARSAEDEIMIIGTEMGILHKLKKEHPEKRFFLLNQGMICKSMKLTTLNSIYKALKYMQYQITVEEATRKKAKKALDRMLELSS